jgi:hypothetical protein
MELDDLKGALGALLDDNMAESLQTSLDPCLAVAAQGSKYCGIESGCAGIARFQSSGCRYVAMCRPSEAAEQCNSSDLREISNYLKAFGLQLSFVVLGMNRLTLRVSAFSVFCYWPTTMMFVTSMTAGNC